MTTPPSLVLLYSDSLQRNIVTYLATLYALASRTSQPARVFETELVLFFRYVVPHFGPNAPKVFLWCKHLTDDLLVNNNLPEPIAPLENLGPSPISDQQYLDVLEQTRQYLNRLVKDMAHDLLGRTPDDLRFYLGGLISICPPETVKPLLSKIQHVAESYLWLGYDVYQPTNQPHPHVAAQGRPQQVAELQKHLTDGHALANFISWRLLKFRRILWFHLVSHQTYGEMADACMAFFAKQKPQ